MTSLPIEYRGKRLPMSITGVRFPATYWRAVSQPQAAQLYSGTVSSDLRGGITAFAEDNIDQIDRLVYVTNLSFLTSPAVGSRICLLGAICLSNMLTPSHPG